jgi:hypothetical protein
MAGDGDLDLDALRDHLAASRRRGLPFEWAWLNACAALVPDEPPNPGAAAVLSATREVWRACYERRPPPPAERTVAALSAVFYEQPVEPYVDRLLG